jgi:hypothetical protein
LYTGARNFLIFRWHLPNDDNVKIFPQDNGIIYINFPRTMAMLVAFSSLIANQEIFSVHLSDDVIAWLSPQNVILHKFIVITL